MLKKIFIVLFVLLVLSFWSCSGTKGSGPELVPFQDNELQAQVNELLNKIDANPSNPAYRRELARIYHENNRSNDALIILEKGLEFDPSDSETRFMYGEIAEQHGDKRRAYTAYKEILQGVDGRDYLDRIAPKFVDVFTVTKVVSTPANEAFGSFSADGKKIIYQADEDGNWDLFEYNFETSEIIQLTMTAEHEETPVYHPGGGFIAYTSTTEDRRNVDFNLKVRDIFILDILNDRHTNVTLNSSDDWRPKYSSNGKFISFVSERDDLRDTDFTQLTGEIYIMESDGRFQLRLTHNDVNDGGACIAPGSTEEKGTIFYNSDETGVFEIYKTDFKGEKITQVTFNPTSNDVSPDISPKGDKIAFFSDRDGNYEIYLMNSDGSAQMRLTANPADDSGPVFSPDGTKVLFHSNRSGNYDIYMLDLNQQASIPGLAEVISNIDQALVTLQPGIE